MKPMKYLLPLVLLLLSVPVFAQSRSVDLTGYATWVDIQGDNRFDTDEGDVEFDFDSEQGYGIAVNVFWSNRLSSEFAVSAVDPEVTLKADDPVLRILNLGQLEMIPITATLQYHFAPDARFDPYVGAGAAYVLFDELKDAEDLDDIEIERIDVEDDLGFVVNAGASFDLTSMLALNFDVKYVPVKSGANVVFADGLGESFDVEVNPLMISAGISLQF